MMMTKTKRAHPQYERLPVQTDVRAGAWDDLWTDVKAVGSDLGDGVSKLGSSAKAAVHNATAPNS